MAANTENPQNQTGLNGTAPAQSAVPPNLPLNLPPGMTLGNLDPNQLMALIRMPGVANMFDKVSNSIVFRIGRSTREGAIPPTRDPSLLRSRRTHVA
jgi:hypothetical protein